MKIDPSLLTDKKIEADPHLRQDMASALEERGHKATLLLSQLQMAMATNDQDMFNESVGELRRIIQEKLEPDDETVNTIITEIKQGIQQLIETKRNNITLPFAHTGKHLTDRQKRMLQSELRVKECKVLSLPQDTKGMEPDGLLLSQIGEQAVIFNYWGELRLLPKDIVHKIRKDETDETKEEPRAQTEPQTALPAEVNATEKTERREEEITYKEAALSALSLYKKLWDKEGMKRCNKCHEEVTVFDNSVTFDFLLDAKSYIIKKLPSFITEEEIRVHFFDDRSGRHLLPSKTCEGSPSRAQYLENQPRDTRPYPLGRPDYVEAREPRYREAYAILEEFKKNEMNKGIKKRARRKKGT